jgi:hypothetical protein
MRCKAILVHFVVCWALSSHNALAQIDSLVTKLDSTTSRIDSVSTKVSRPFASLQSKADSLRSTNPVLTKADSLRSLNPLADTQHRIDSVQSQIKK